MRYYSGDSHVVEGRDAFAGLEEKFGRAAPHIEKDLGGKKGEFLVIGDNRPVPVGRLGIAGKRLDDPATDELIARGYDGLNPGVLDSELRLAEQDTDGIAGEVMYPSLSMFTFAVEDPKIKEAAFQRHNDWVFDYCSPDPDRLIGIGCLPVPDVDACIREVKRAGGKGVRGFSIPSHTLISQPYCDPVYDPLWALLQEMDLPITMHIFTGTSFDCGLPDHWGTPGGTVKGYTLSHTTVVNSTIDIIIGGVVERFPRLKFVLAEFETGWVAHFKQRFDHAAYRTPWELDKSLTMKPSEYFDRNFWVTFEDDVHGIQTRHDIGIDNLVWGNDYPHHDSIWPNSMDILSDVLSGVPQDEKDRMVWNNVIGLYNLDPAKLPGA
ncbi:MAG: putative TIM-barrel fold metal-dependent hydrolase [Acidimicrobiales bacterium]|jgi:predicted TIM-barrel fold metal-dependent hydrolase